jgi:hypothetical protein
MLEFGYTSSFFKPENTEYLDSDFKGYILKFVRTK